LGLLIVAQSAQARGGSLLESEQNTVDVFRRVSSSVVFITNSAIQRDYFNRDVGEVPRGTGSGFIWDRRGHVVTNFHVIRGANSITVTLANGENRRAAVIGVDQNKDLAVLRVDGKSKTLKPVAIGDSSALLVGQKVLAIGNPFGLDQTLTTGVVSALGREITSIAGTKIQDVVQTDASINPGNSGGPLLDSNGRLIGVNTAIFSPTGSNAGIGFAVPVDTVRRVVPQLIRYGKVKRAGLGVTILPDDLARSWGVKGVVIRDVYRQSAAARAGLVGVKVSALGKVTIGDVIIGIDRKKVLNFNDLFGALDARKAGEQVTVHVKRDGKKYRVQLHLQEIQ